MDHMFLYVGHANTAKGGLRCVEEQAQKTARRLVEDLVRPAPLVKLLREVPFKSALDFLEAAPDGRFGGESLQERKEKRELVFDVLLPVDLLLFLGFVVEIFVGGHHPNVPRKENNLPRYLTVSETTGQKRTTRDRPPRKL